MNTKIFILSLIHILEAVISFLTNTAQYCACCTGMKNAAALQFVQNRKRHPLYLRTDVFSVFLYTAKRF